MTAEGSSEDGVNILQTNIYILIVGIIIGNICKFYVHALNQDYLNINIVLKQNEYNIVFTLRL